MRPRARLLLACCLLAGFAGVARADERRRVGLSPISVAPDGRIFGLRGGAGVLSSGTIGEIPQAGRPMPPALAWATGVRALVADEENV